MAPKLGLKMNKSVIRELLQKVNSLPDIAARDAALTLLLATLEFHRAGLERLLEMIGDAGDRNRLASDPLVSSLLLWHDLHPLDLETRVSRTLSRPEFQSCAGHVELISIRQGGSSRPR